jgi:hypothetical protein
MKDPLMTQPQVDSTGSTSSDPAQPPAAPAAAAQPPAPATEFAWKVHAYTNEYIRFADTKAGAVIAWCGGLMGVLFAANAHHHFMKAGWAGTWAATDCWVTSLAAASVLAFILLTLGAVAAFWCVKPRLWSTERSRTHDRGFIYWEAVRAYGDASAFTEALGLQDTIALTQRTSEHVFVLGGIAKTKFLWVDRAIWLAFGGSLFAAIVALFSGKV